MAFGTPVVNSAHNNSLTSPYTPTVAAVTAGRIIVVQVYATRASSVSPTDISLSDTSGSPLTWTPIFAGAQPLSDNGATRSKTQWWWAVSDGSSHTLSLASASTSTIGAEIIDFSIGSGMTPDFTTNQAFAEATTGTSTTSDPVCTLPTAPAAADLGLCFKIGQGGGALSVITGWTSLTRTSVGSRTMDSAYDTSSAAQSVTWTNNGNPAALITMVGVKEVTASGSPYTLTADAGSYTYAGQDVGFPTARMIAALQGDYLYAGQNVILTKQTSYTVLAGFGGYTYAGQDVALKTPSHAVSADPGAYTYAGQDVTLTRVSITSNLEYFDDQSGTVPNGWTTRWITSDVTWTETAAIGSGYLRAAATGDNRHLISWDEMAGGDYEVLTKVRTNVKVSGGIYGCVIFRGSGTSTPSHTEYGYRVGLIDTGGVGQLSAAKYINGTASNLSTGTTPGPVTIDGTGWLTDFYYWLRAQCIGGVIRARAWRDGQDEPGTWQIDATDSSITSTSPTSTIWTGAFAFSGTSASNVDFESFTYNSAGTAPMTTINGSQLFNLASGATPANWAPTGGWTQTNVTWLEDAGGFLQAKKTTSSALRNLLYVRTSAGDLEIMAKVRSSFSPSNTANAIGPALICRAGGTAGFENGFIASLRNDASGVSNTASLVRLPGTGGAEISLYSNASSTWTQGTWYRIRLRTIGSTISFKWWLDGSAEPGSWTATVTDATKMAAGAGLFIFNTQTTTDWDWFTFATNGATAPEPGAYVVTADPGGYAYTGNSVALTATRSIAALQGDYLYAGQNVTLIRTGGSPYIMPVGQGDYIVSGIGANLRVTASVLAAGVGAYAYAGQDVTLTKGSVSIGGIPIGTPGTGLYAGLKLVAGDDFTTKPVPWNFRNTAGNYSSVVLSGAPRRYNTFEMMNFVDATYRGPRHESQTDFGSIADPFSVSGSILTITSSVRDSGLDTHMSYNSTTGYIDQTDVDTRPKNISGALMTAPSFMLEGQGDWIVEAYFKMQYGTINGYTDGFWTSAFNWPDWGELDFIETYQGASRKMTTSLHINSTDGGPESATTIAGPGLAFPAVNRFVQVLIKKTASTNTLDVYNDFATAGTLALVGTYSDATRVSRFRGPHDLRFDLNVYTHADPSNVYNPAHWPAIMQFDWWRAWTPTGGEDNLPLIELTAFNTTPGGSWATTFPAANVLYGSGFTPDLEDIRPIADNEDGPGLLGRLPGGKLNGLTVDIINRNTSGTVPLTEGGTVALFFNGSMNIGGPARRAFKRFNVAPAEQQGKVFPSCSASIGESFSRTIAFTDFHSGNLGPHTYTVTKSGAGAGDFTITGSGGNSVTITGTIATTGTTTFQIDCTNTNSQTTTITRTVDAKAQIFHWDFRNGVYQHQGTNYADPAALITASKMTFALAAAGANANWYAEDWDGNLVSRSVANNLRISNKGLAYEPAVTNLMASSNIATSRALSNVTVTENIINGASGTLTADRITSTVGTSTTGHYIASFAGGVTYTMGLPYTLQAWVKMGQTRIVQIAGTQRAWSGNGMYINLDLDRGYVGAVGSDVQSYSFSGAPFLGKGWWHVSITGTAYGSLIVGLSKASTAICTVSSTDIVNFAAGNTVVVAGIPAPNAGLNGTYTVGTLTGNTFPLTGMNTSGISVPLDQTNAPGMAIIPSGTNGVMVGFCNDDINATKQPGYTGSTEHNFYLWNTMLEQKASPSVIVNNAQTTNLSVTKPADALSVFLPTGCNGVRFRFEDGSTQDITGLTANANYAVPTTLNRTFITEMTGLTAGAYILGALQGDYAYTGQNVTLTKTTAYSLAAQQGDYVLGGQNVNLIKTSTGTYSMPVAQGDYAIGGQAVNLIYASPIKVMPALQGVYVYTGNDVNLIYNTPNKKLIVDVGQYLYAGQDVQLRYSGAAALASVGGGGPSSKSKTKKRKKRRIEEPIEPDVVAVEPEPEPLPERPLGPVRIGDELFPASEFAPVDIPRAEWDKNIQVHDDEQRLEAVRQQRQTERRQIERDHRMQDPEERRKDDERKKREEKDIMAILAAFL